MKKKIFVLFLIFTFLLTAFGCSATPDKEDKDNTKIVTSFYPMYVFTINLVKGMDDVTVENITQQVGGCLHDYQLLPKDMVTLHDASLFVINGAGMEDFMDKVFSQLPQLTVVESSTGITLLAQEEDHDDDDHDHDVNAHVWLSVPNAIVQVKNIANALCDILPGNTDTIRENEREYIARLEALDAEIRADLSGDQGTQIVTFHEAYTYFANEYGLTILGTIESDDNEEPSAKELAALSKKIQANNVNALFVEPEYKGTSAKVLANETGAKIYTLNPITSGDGSLSSYEDIMRSNLNVIKEAIH